MIFYVESGYNIILISERKIESFSKQVFRGEERIQDWLRVYQITDVNYIYSIYLSWSSK